jgi:hypothetical protein
LEAIYNKTLGTDQVVDTSDLARELGMSFEEGTAAWHSLSDRSLIKTFGAENIARINADGVDTIEKAKQHPDQPTSGFGSVTYNTVTIHHMEHSAIQQAGAKAYQVQSIGYSAQELANLQKALDLFEKHVDELDLDDATKKKALAQVATIQAQLTDEPDPVIVKQAGRTLRNITEGAIGGLIATAAQPGIWQFVADVLTKLH